MADSVILPPLPPGADFSQPTAANAGAASTGSVSLPSGNLPTTSVNTADNTQGLGGNSGFSLADILNKVAGTNASSQAAQAGITQSFSDLQSAGSAMVAALTQKGQDDTLVSQTQGLGQLRAQENSRKVASALGTNMDDAGQILTGLASTMLDSYTKSQAAAQHLQDVTSTNFLDDPLKWISDQFERGPAAANYNAEATKYNSAEQTLSSVLALTSADVKVQNDIAQTKTAASVQASSDSVAQEAVINQQKVQQQNLLYNVQGIQAVQQMSEAQLNNSVQALSAINASESLQIQQQNAARANATSALQAQEMQQRIQLNQMNLDDMTSTADLVNKGRASMGLAPLPPVKVAQLLKISGPTGQAIKDQYTAGASTDAIGKTIVSDNSGDAARIITTSRAPLTPAQTPIKNLLQDTYGGVQSGTLAKDIDLKNPAAVAARTAQFVTQKSVGMANSINPSDGTNIYQPPDLQSIASLPGVQSTPLFQKVLAPVLAAGQQAGQVTKFDPEVVSGMALAAVNAGTISFNDAVSGMTALANGAVMTNNVTKDYTKFGIRPQSSLNMKVADPVSGRAVVYDFTKAAQVSNYYAKTQAGQVQPGTLYSTGLNLQ